MWRGTSTASSLSNLRGVRVRLLIVEDDTKIGKTVAQALEASGYDVEWVTTGQAALDVAAAEPPALVLLDLGLPDVDGVDVCAQLRAMIPAATIVILTARADEIDVVVGLDAGADDYVTKPFRLGELLARVRAHLRRPHLHSNDETIVVGDLFVDLAGRKAECSGTEVDLRPKEFDLLAFLVANAGRAMTREHIMEQVWDEHWFGSTKTLDMHISALRRKLGECDNPVAITTLRGVGYRVERPPE
jgi:DNA-binding response OmpR family regulator